VNNGLGFEPDILYGKKTIWSVLWRVLYLI